MRWPWWLRWGRHRNGTAAQAKADQAAKLAKAERDEWLVHHLARNMANLPDDEFARQVEQTFRRRHA